MIKIAHIGLSHNRGGIESFVMNIYRNIDRSEFQFDFLVNHDFPLPYEEEIKKLGGRVFYNLYSRRNPKRFINNIVNFLKEENYDAVHIHRTNIADLDYLWMAKKAGIKKRILHSHSTGYINMKKLNFFARNFERYNRNHLSEVANINLACSYKAGDWMFGDLDYTFIPNGIELKKFEFSEDFRKELREKYGFNDNNYVIGHVATFLDFKNHEFVIELFEKYYKQNKNAVLFLVGDGKLKSGIERLVNEKNLQKNVVFAGLLKNVNELYSMFDCFILPSKFEGLPIVGIEAQANGLPCLFSEKITSELKINDNVEFLNIIDSDVWASRLDEIKKMRIYSQEKLLTKGYDISQTVNKLSEIYKG